MKNPRMAHAGLFPFSRTLSARPRPLNTPMNPSDSIGTERVPDRPLRGGPLELIRSLLPQPLGTERGVVLESLL